MRSCCIQTSADGEVVTRNDTWKSPCSLKSFPRRKFSMASLAVRTPGSSGSIMASTIAFTSIPGSRSATTGSCRRKVSRQASHVSRVQKSLPATFDFRQAPDRPSGDPSQSTTVRSVAAFSALT